MTFLALSTQAILTVLGALAALLAIRTARTPQGAVVRRDKQDEDRATIWMRGRGAAPDEGRA